MLESTLKKQRLQFLQQFAAQSRSSPQHNWTSPGIQILPCVLPDFGPYQALDILTISPRRHSNISLWRKASSWWKQTCVWWHQSTWDITINALSPEERFLDLLYTPIWFPIDLQLHFERQRRSTTASAHRRCLGMVPEPGRSFRMRFAQAFRIRSLHDLFGSGTACFDSDQSLSCVLVQAQWAPRRIRPRQSFYVGCTLKQRKFFDGPSRKAYCCVRTIPRRALVVPFLVSNSPVSHSFFRTSPGINFFGLLGRSYRRTSPTRCCFTWPNVIAVSHNLGDGLLQAFQPSSKTLASDLFGHSIPPIILHITCSSTLLVLTTIQAGYHPVHSEPL